MPLLDDLKAERQKLQTKKEAEHRRTQALELAYRERLKPAMRRIFRYLSELLDHINYIQPETPVEFTLPVYGRMQGLQQGGYRLTVDSLDAMQKIRLRFRCGGGETARFKASPPSVAADLREQFLDHSLSFEARDYYDDFHNVVGQKFEVKGEIPVLISVDADLEQTLVRLQITNFDSPLRRQAVYRPEQISAEFLDDLGNFVLRKNNRLIELPLSSEERQELRERVVREQRSRTSRLIANLFRREKR